MGQSPYQPPQQQPQQGYQSPGQGYGQPPGQPGWAAQRSQAEPWATRSRLAGGLLIAGALLAIIASFLPWGSISFGGDNELFAGIDASESFNGFEGSDGWLALATGVIVIALGVMALVRATGKGVKPIGIAVMVAGILLGLWLAFIAVANMSEPEGELGGLDAFGLEHSVGIGLWVMLLGALLVLAGAGFMVASHLAAPKDGSGPSAPGGQGYQQPPQQGQYGPPGQGG